MALLDWLLGPAEVRKAKRERNIDGLIQFLGGEDERVRRAAGNALLGMGDGCVDRLLAFVAKNSGSGCNARQALMAGATVLAILEMLPQLKRRVSPENAKKLEQFFNWAQSGNYAERAFSETLRESYRQFGGG